MGNSSNQRFKQATINLLCNPPLPQAFCKSVYMEVIAAQYYYNRVVSTHTCALY